MSNDAIDAGVPAGNGVSTTSRPSEVAAQPSADRDGPSVLHVVEALRGGPASYLQEMLPYLVERLGGRNVTLIAPDDQVVELGGDAGVEVQVFRTARFRPWNVLRLIRAVRRAVAARGFDIVHAQGTFAGVAVRLALRGMVDAPAVIYCSHGWAFDRRVRPWKNVLCAWAERQLARWADAIVCISEHDYASGSRIGIDPVKLVTIVNGIGERAPAAPAEGAAPVAWPAGTRRFLFVGRFDRQKGIDTFLDAMHRAGTGAYAYAVGGHVVGRRQTLDFPGNVKPTGWLDRTEVQRYLASADVVVMPSRWEGFGLTAVEAMRAGKPVIASNVGGLAEVVQDGVTGLLVRPDDVGALVRAMQSLDDERIRAMSIAGRQRFLDYFHADKMNAAMVGLYQRLATRHQRAVAGGPVARAPATGGAQLEKRPLVPSVGPGA